MIDGTETSVDAPNGEYRTNSEFDGKSSSEKVLQIKIFPNPKLLPIENISDK